MAEGECLARERERERETGNADKKRELRVYPSLSTYCSYPLFFRSLNAAPAGDDILTESDAVNILEELTEALGHANILGVMLCIKPVELEAISKMYQDPKERFYQIILAFLRQAEPRPTWRAIANALKSPIVNLTALAKRVEAAHFPDPTASRDPPTTSGESANPPNPCLQHCAVSSSLPSPAVTPGERSNNGASDATPQPPSVPPSNTQSNPPSLSGKLS